MDKFINLPAELIHYILSYLGQLDLSHLSHLNKDWNELTKYLLYRHVRLKWHNLKSSENFHLTERLVIKKGEEKHDTFQTSSEQIPWRDLQDEFLNVINVCDPNKLTMFSLQDCGITDKIMKSVLVRFNNLRTLCLFNCRSIGRYSWLALRKISTLKTLNLKNTSIKDKYLHDVLKDLELNVLEIGYPNKLLPGSFRWVTEETQLVSLKYHRVFICMNSLQQIDRLVNLEKLDLEGSFIGDNIFKKICSHLLKLKCLNVSHCQLDSGQCMEHLEELKYLNDLNLHGNNITDASLPYIAKCISLVHLNLSFNRLITDEGILCLVSLENLKTLELSMNTELTNASAQTIAKMKSLQKLDVSNCIRIGDKGIRYISRLQTLTHLDVSGCELLTQECLKYTEKLVKLKVFLHDLLLLPV